MPCLFPYYTEAIQKQTGLSKRFIKKALDTLCDTHWIAIQDGMVWVKNGLRYDPNISLKNPKHIEAIKKILLGLPKSKLVVDFCNYYKIDIPYVIPYTIPNREAMAYPMPFPEPEPEPEKISSKFYRQLLNLFNKSCPNLPKARELNQSRKEKIKARLKEHPDLSWWEETFIKANEVSFIGKDGREWRPSFDWLIKNDDNGVKVIEGNYDQKCKGPFKPQPGISSFLKKEMEKRNES